MPRRVKLVHVSILLPRMIRDELVSAARHSRRSVSGYASLIIREWYDKQTAHKEKGVTHGDEKTLNETDIIG